MSIDYKKHKQTVSKLGKRLWSGFKKEAPPALVGMFNYGSNTFLNFGNRNIALRKIITDGNSPNEYKDPCHQGIRTIDNPVIKNRKLKSFL